MAGKGILITGASGFVGGHTVTAAAQAGPVFALSRQKPPDIPSDVLWIEGDSLDPDIVEAALAEYRPQACIHAAANPNIDQCEADPGMAQRVNADGAATVAERCVQHGVRLVHVSTDTVFDGEHAPYREESRADPINAYGRGKRDAEQRVAALAPEAAIVRIPIIYGFHRWPHGNTFMQRLEAQLAEADPPPIRVLPEEVRTPLDVVTAGRALVEVALSQYAGILHVAGAERLDRVTFTRAIVERMGYSGDWVTPVTQADLPNRAPRPRDISLTIDKAVRQLKTPLPGLEAGLALVFGHR